MAFQRLGVRRVDHHHLLKIQLAQRVIHRVGIHPGRLHHHVRDAAAAQLAGHLLEHPVKRAELQHIGLAGPALRARHPDRDLDHVLVHIDRGHPVIQHSHAPPPEAASETNREHTACRPTGPLTSIRRLTHALAAAAGMTRNGDPSTTLNHGLGTVQSTPVTTDGTPGPACTFRPATVLRNHGKPRADPSPAPISSRASRHEVAHLFLNRSRSAVDTTKSAGQSGIQPSQANSGGKALTYAAPVT